jgi:hypothetical protein
MVSAQALASYQVDQADDRSVGFRPAGLPLQLEQRGSILPPRCSGNTHSPYHRSTQEESLRIYGEAHLDRTIGVAYRRQVRRLLDALTSTLEGAASPLLTSTDTGSYALSLSSGILNDRHLFWWGGRLGIPEGYQPGHG